MVFRAEDASVQEHDRRVLRVLVVVQGLLPEHTEGPDEVWVGAGVRVLQDLVEQVLPVGFIVDGLAGVDEAGELPGLRPAEDHDVPHAVKLRADGGADGTLRPQVLIEVRYVLELFSDDLHDGLDVRLALELLHEVSFQAGEVVNH